MAIDDVIDAPLAVVGCSKLVRPLQPLAKSMNTARRAIFAMYALNF